MDESVGARSRKFVAPQELAAVTALPGPKRYAHLVAQVADWQEVWGLRSAEGWVSAAGDSGKMAFPVWPHEAYAAQCVAGSWIGSVPTPIEVHQFLASYLPSMASEQTQVAVFPTPAGSVVIVNPEEFALSVRAELSRVE